MWCASVCRCMYIWVSCEYVFVCVYMHVRTWVCVSAYRPCHSDPWRGLRQLLWERVRHSFRPLSHPLLHPHHLSVWRWRVEGEWRRGREGWRDGKREGGREEEHEWVEVTYDRLWTVQTLAKMSWSYCTVYDVLWAVCLQAVRSMQCVAFSTWRTPGLLPLLQVSG